MSLQRNINKEEVKHYRHAIKEIQSVVSDNRLISGKTHNFYKYPACFHPSFSNSVIKNFSEPGDTVIDPFVGGGTSAVEASYLQRNLIGVDINPVAVFLSKFKTLRLTKKDIEELDEFFNDLISIKLGVIKSCSIREEFKKGVAQSFINLIGHIKSMICNLENSRSQMFARGILLRRSKLVFDNPNKALTRVEFIRSLFWDYEALVDEHLVYHEECKQMRKELGVEKTSLKIINGSIAEEKTINKVERVNSSIDLLVTSPPYPQKHILYNKWQADGRIENYLPYWIIDSEEIKSESYYTMGGRSKSGEKQYYETIEKSFSNIRRVMSNDGLVVQMVAFFDRSRQLRPFLESMSAAGFKEVRNLTSHFDRRIWRDVPNRKWFNSANKRRACQEVVLFHVPWASPRILDMVLSA